MLFNSFQFLVFFPIVVLLYFVLPTRIRSYWLLVASYYFYMCWNARYALLILFSTLVTYVTGRILERKEEESRFRRLTLAACILLNLSILFVYKYLDFALGLLQKAFSVVHITLNVPAFDLLLPVGISFYTFQALGYAIDVYRGDVKAEHNFFRYALFVSFFPQLVAGPIERSGRLLSQLRTPTRFSYDRFREGILLMLWGFFLKVVLADRIAIFVDTVYNNSERFSGLFIVIATMLFAVQIYCDFGGYSTIAMGTAKILGIDLMENFNAPYLAESVGEFWRRWHISLTSWFKDYLYIPLGGSRCGVLRKNINRMIVFLVSGLWHGASLSFVVWGGLNGLYQVIADIVRPLRDRLNAALGLDRSALSHRLAHIAGTFLLVDFSWIFFRAGSLGLSITLIKRMLTNFNPWIFVDGSLYYCGLDEKNFMVLGLSLCLLLFADLAKARGTAIREVLLRQETWFRCLFFSVCVTVLLIFGVWGPAYDAASFIYFQF